MGVERKAVVAAAVLCAVLAAVPAKAQDSPGSDAPKKDPYSCNARGPLDCYLGNTNFALLSCRLNGEIALMKYSMGDRAGLDKTSKCIDEAKTATEASFSAAKKQLAGNEKAVSMLKDHYAAFLAAVDDLFPGGTSERAYKAKAEANESRIKEMGTRVKLEQ